MSGGREYKRLTLSQRGHFSNCPTLNPVLSICFQPSHLLLTTRRRTATYSYSVLTSNVHSGYMWKGYGRAAGAYIKQTLVTIRAPDATYKFDLSGQFPDFTPPAEVLELISSQMQVTRTSTSLRQVKRGQTIFAVIFFGILLAMLVFFKYLGL